MDCKSSVASSSSSSPAAAAVAAGGDEALPGFSREEQAALQWAVEMKKRELSKVCVYVFVCLLAACSFSQCFSFFFTAVPLGGAMG